MRHSDSIQWCADSCRYSHRSVQAAQRVQTDDIPYKLVP
jgi:hypothetical protein